MWNDILINLQSLGFFILAYFISVGINILLGIYNSISSFKQDFSLIKLINGLIRAGIIAISCGGIVIIASFVPQLMEGLPFSEEIKELIKGITVTGVYSLLIVSTGNYIKQILEKLGIIMSGNVQISIPTDEFSLEDPIENVHS